MFPRSHIHWLFTFTLTAWFAGGVEAAETTPKPVRRHALLVGVGRYEGLTQAEQLFGCANDVALMRELLTSRFGFAPGEVRTLIDGEATGAAIRAALAQLADQVTQAADDEQLEIVFHFSGHGSQVEDQPPGHVDHDEDDGLDESFVPTDSTLADGKTDRDLRDDELYRFLETICRHPGVRAWIVLDCCHSGTGARGARFRRLNRGLAVKRASADTLPAKRAQLPPGAVCLSACRADEMEPEFDDGTKTYGLLTRFLAQSIESRAELSQLNYERLRQILATTYRTSPMAIDAPEPQWDGEPGTLGQVVLRATTAADRSPEIAVAPLDKAAGRVTLAAGAFQGITRGATLEVTFGGEGAIAKQRTALARVDSVSATQSTALLLDPGDAANRALTWPADAVSATALQRAAGPQQAGLRFRVVRAAGPDRDGPALSAGDEDLKPLERAAAEARRPGEIDWLSWVTDADSELLVRVDGRYAAIFPSIGRARVSPNPDSRYPASLHGGWGPIDLVSADAQTQFLDLCRRIARARNLLRISETLAAANTNSHHSGVRLELVAAKLDDKFNIVEAAPWTAKADGSLQMEDGDIYAVRLTNDSPHERYATLLTVGADLGIEVLVPNLQAGGVGQRLAPGEVRLSDPFQCDATVGPRHAVLLATPEPNELWYAAQESLPTVRAAPSPFAAAIFEQTHFRSRRVGSSSPTPFPEATVRVLRWDGCGERCPERDSSSSRP